jgi:NAD(P)-dependent dehydrogenase (short-subunit alcohol dehydrogenase family)
VSYDVAGRVVLITGAARGIGADSARQLARRGARLALAGLEPNRLEALCTELGGEAAWWEADVRDAAAVQAAVDGAVERFGGIDVVVANAGIRPPAATVASVDPASFERVIDVDLMGVWRTVRAALPHVTARRGYLLSIASLAAAHHAPMMAPYAMAKAGVEALMNSLRLEVEHKGVACGTGYFGFIDTDMVRSGMEQAPARLMQRRSPRWLTQPLPVERAGRAVVRGIERRARRVYAPRWILPALLAPGLLQPLVDAGARRQGVSDAVAEAERNPER